MINHNVGVALLMLRAGTMTTKLAAASLLASLAVGACLVTGCSASDPSDAVAGASDAIELTDAKAEADAVIVAPDSVTFPARIAKSKRVTDLVSHTVSNETVFLVGDRASNAVMPDGTINPASTNPNGYLRKVVSAETLPNGDTKFTTQPASLIEAQPAMQAQGFKVADSGGCFPQSTNPFNLYNLDLSRTLYTKQFGSIGGMNIRLVSSTVNIDGNLDTEVTGHCISPDSAHALLTLNLKGQVVLEGDFSGAFGAETGTIELYHKQIAITSVLGYPLALDFSVEADCDFASTGKATASVGASIDGSVLAGGNWQSGQGFSTVFQPTWPQPHAVGPTFSTNANITAKCSLTAKGQALIFDSSEGPYATASTYLQIDGTGQGSGAGASVDAKLTAGVDVGLGGSLKPFDYTILDNINAPLFSKDWTLFEQTYSVTP